MLEFLFIAVFLIVGSGGIAFYNFYRKKKVMEVAESMGLEFIPQANHLRHELTGCDLMSNAGDKHKCINCFGGEADGIRFYVFEYQYWTGFGKRRTKHSQTVGYINLPHLELPNFHVEPNTFMGKLFKGNRVHGIKLDPEFDKAFFVGSAQHPQTRAIFNDDLKSEIRSNQWWMDVNNGRVLLYRSGRTVGHKELEMFLKQSLKMMQVLELSVQKAAESTAAESAEPAATVSPTAPVILPESPVAISHLFPTS